MKSKLKSAFITVIVGLFCACILAGCDELPHVFGGNEVPDDVIAEPRVVQQPKEDVQNKPWQRLGDVPSMPKDFPTPTAVDQLYHSMENDRREGQAINYDYENPTPPEPQQ